MNLQNRSIILIGRRYGKNNTQPTCKNATFVNISVPPFIRPHYSASDSTLFYLLPFPFLSKFKFEHMTERVRKFFSRISRNRDQNTIFLCLFYIPSPYSGHLKSDFVVFLLLLTARCRRTRKADQKCPEKQDKKSKRDMKNSILVSIIGNAAVIIFRQKFLPFKSVLEIVGQ